MTKPKALAALFSTASLLALAPQAHAQTGGAPAEASVTAPGGVAGHVIGLKDNKPLAGAVVRIRETGASATTSADGSYAFGNLPPGAYTLVVTASNGVENEARIKVAAGETTSRDLSSDNKSTALQEIVVLAQRAPAAVARAAQMQAPNLIVIQTYQEIRKLPDISAAEAVRRVPGISLETDEGEGRYVNIRGLDADLNSTTFGGLRLPPTNNASPQGGYRAVTMDSIPVGLVGAITVTKTNLPEQDAEALGGTIEITPKTAPRGGEPFIQGNIGSGVEALHGTGIIDVGVTAGGHFGGSNGFFSPGPFSIVVTGTYYEDRRHFDDVEPDQYFNDSLHPYQALQDIQQRDYELNRKRHGVGIDLGYEPNDNDSWYVRAFEAGYTERYKRQFLEISPDGNATLSPNGQIMDTLQGASANPPSLNVPANFPASFQKSLRDEDETSTDRVFVAGGKNIFGEAVLDYRIGYTEGTYHKPYDVNSSFAYQPTAATIAYSLTGPGHVPIYTVTDPTGANYLDPANYTLASLSNSKADNFDRELSFSSNYQYPLHFIGSDESIKAGFHVRLRHKRTTSPQLSYSNLPALPLTSAISGPPETYYGGIYHNGPDIMPGYLQALFGPGTTAPSPGPGLLSSDQALTEEQYLDAKENVYAGYGEYKMTLGKFGIIAGVRVEGTEDHYNAFNVQKDISGNFTSTPTSSHKSYVNVFPGAQLRYEIQPDLVARASFSSTIARPGFNQSTATTVVDFGSLKITHGNPALKPITANSFDLSLEKYLGGSGIASIGLFYKDLSNYIIATNGGFQTISGNSLQDVTFSNAPSGSYARGIELNLDERFQMLPDPFDGIGVSANYTYVDSQFEIRPGEHSPLPSTSKNTWNAAIFYEKGPVGLRLAAYSTSADLFTVGGDRTSDVFNATRTSMDFGANYKVDPHWVVYFNAKNLLNTPHAFYEGTPDRPIQREFYGQTYQFGARFDY
jgi:TonB-dependent receptor